MARSPSATVISVLCVLLLVTAKATSQATEDSSDGDQSYLCPDRARQFFQHLFQCLVPVDEDDRCGTLETIRTCVEEREKTCVDEAWMTDTVTEGIWRGFILQTNKLGLEDCHEKENK